jgi:hypothetical protein
LNDLYRVPRLRIAAQIQTIGRQVRHVALFLGDRAQNHPGPERPSDLLNRGTFLPAIERDEIEFLSIDAVILVSVDAELEFGSDDLTSLDAALSATTHRRVLIELDDGTSLHGDLTYVLPAGQSRIQDYLNSKERFLSVRDGNQAHLINKRHVVLVTPE